MYQSYFKKYLAAFQRGDSDASFLPILRFRDMPDIAATIAARKELDEVLDTDDDLGPYLEKIQPKYESQRKALLAEARSYLDEKSPDYKGGDFTEEQRATMRLAFTVDSLVYKKIMDRFEAIDPKESSRFSAKSSTRYAYKEASDPILRLEEYAPNMGETVQNNFHYATGFKHALANVTMHAVEAEGRKRIPRPLEKQVLHLESQLADYENIRRQLETEKVAPHFPDVPEYAKFIEHSILSVQGSIDVYALRHADVLEQMHERDNPSTFKKLGKLFGLSAKSDPNAIMPYLLDGKWREEPGAAEAAARERIDSMKKSVAGFNKIREYFGSSFENIVEGSTTGLTTGWLDEDEFGREPGHMISDVYSDLDRERYYYQTDIDGTGYKIERVDMVRDYSSSKDIETVVHQAPDLKSVVDKMVELDREALARGSAVSDYMHTGNNRYIQRTYDNPYGIHFAEALPYHGFHMDSLKPKPAKPYVEPAKPVWIDKPIPPQSFRTQLFLAEDGAKATMLIAMAEKDKPAPDYGPDTPAYMKGGLFDHQFDLIEVSIPVRKNLEGVTVYDRNGSLSFEQHRAEDSHGLQMTAFKMMGFSNPDLWDTGSNTDALPLVKEDPALLRSLAQSNAVIDGYKLTDMLGLPVAHDYLEKNNIGFDGVDAIRTDRLTSEQMGQVSIRSPLGMARGEQDAAESKPRLTTRLSHQPTGL